jgi:hypothetical protein
VARLLEEAVNDLYESQKGLKERLAAACNALKESLDDLEATAKDVSEALVEANSLESVSSLFSPFVFQHLVYLHLPELICLANNP